MNTRGKGEFTDTDYCSQYVIETQEDYKCFYTFVSIVKTIW